MLGPSCLLLATFAATLAGNDAALRLENAELTLTLSATPAPHIVELTHKASGRRLVQAPTLKNLFTFRLADADGKTSHVESSTAKQTAVRAESAGAKRLLRIEFGRFPALDADVRVTASATPDDPLVRWSIAIDNRSSRRLTSVRFPLLTALPALDDPADDFLVLPTLPGALIENPAANWPRTYSVSLRYPGDQSAQFLSYQDRTAGIYLVSMDTRGNSRNLTASKRPEGMQLWHDYILPALVPTHWESPYDVALGVTAGMWQQTADRYKRWAERQPWCARRLADRDDVPDSWKRGPCIHTCEVRTYDRNRVCNGSYYDRLPEHLRELRAKIGGPVAPMLAGWENHRRWTAGDYFPIFDDAHARRTIAELRRDGFAPFCYLSGLFYTFENEGRDESKIPNAERYQASYVIDAQSGKPKTYVLNESSPQGAWKRHSYEFCPAAPGTKAFFRTVLDQMHALGVDIVQMDQTVSGATGACYSSAHGHPPGPGPYQTRAFWDLLADLRRYGKSLSPQFVFLHEEPHEELIPYLDGFHTREYKEGSWYRGAPGARGIPLFSYLYHEYAIAYGGEGPSAVKGKSPVVVWQHAVNFVTGKTPAVSVWSNQAAMAEADADQIQMLRNHASLLQTEAGRFLMLGRMLHSLPLEAPPLTLQFSVRREGKWRTEPFHDRAVLTSSWQSPEGLVGHLLVNVTNARQPLRFPLDTRNAPGWSKTDADLHRAAEPGAPTALFRGVSLPQECKLELEPLAAAFIVLRPAK